ncbi:MAG: leucyl/phenylalanyl-tRNA--protein transferase [Rhodobacteraceae bacterium]|nr:leucyl/phenylalanyl-tRNA--protein transferase [Paracoccaceae bacterium]
MSRDDAPSVTPELLLHAYASGVFPMSESRDDPTLFWVDPDRRGVLPLDGFYLSRSLRRTQRRDTYAISYNTAFAAVVDGCADRDDTWINATIRALYLELHQRGAAHSVEVWKGGDLVGGVYGVTLGAAFFGESMFSTARDASKVALAHLVDRLNRCGFTLLDTQFITPHLANLGAVEISREAYHRRLAAALRSHAVFDATLPAASGQDVVQRITQTS